MSRVGSPPRVGDEATLEIEDLALGGRGVARVSGFVVFVKGALPGERTRVRVDRVKAGYAEGDCIDILRVSPDRIAPPCRHYGECGGCDLQHLSSVAQAMAKRRQVIAALQRIAGVEEPSVRDAIPAGEPTMYRFGMDFDWGTGSGGGEVLGLHRAGRPAEVMTIERCLLMPEAANAIRSWIGRRAETLGLKAWNAKRRRGLLRRAGIRISRSTGETLVIVETGRGNPPALFDLARDLVRAFPRIVGVVRREFDRRDRPSGQSILQGRDHLFETVGEDRLKVPAWTFFQPNAAAVGALRETVIRTVAPAGGDAILELYCGVGLFTLPLARAARHVVGIDVSRDAIIAARENAAGAGLSNARFLCADAAQALPGLLQEGRWDALLLDPPRTGLAPAVVEAIRASGIPRVVYVSCDPATLARDVRQLIRGDGLRLRSVSVLDLFPQTHHVECVALLERPDFEDMADGALSVPRAGPAPGGREPSGHPRRPG